MEGFTITLPLDKVQASYEKGMLRIKGEKGEIQRKMNMPQLSLSLKENSIVVTTKRTTKMDKKLAFTHAAHIRNMIKGASKGHTYILKVCASHFPMNVSVNKNQLIIKNFIGEKYPRTLDIKEGVAVKVEGDKVIVESVNKELAGTTASDIEHLTKRADYDPRIFQDGIYIINKDGKEIQ